MQNLRMLVDSADSEFRGLYARLAGLMFLTGIGEYFFGDYLISQSLKLNGNAISAWQFWGPPEIRSVGLFFLFCVSWQTVVLAGALYAFLRPVGPGAATIALLWRTVEVVFGAAATALKFLRADVPGNFHTVLNVAIRCSFDISEVFFASGSAVFFVLLFRSRFIPRILAAWGVFGSLAIAVPGIAGLIATYPPPWTANFGLPILAGEAATGLWLLVIGVDTRGKRNPLF